MIVGVVGGGQLGRMLGLAGIPLGIRSRFLDPSGEAPAAAVGEHLRAAFDDADALTRLAAGTTAVTYEFENVPAAATRRLESVAVVRPSSRSLEVSQDRLEEKRFLRSCGVATAAFAAVHGPASLEPAMAETGLPAVLKTRRLGYDGKGQAVVRTVTQAQAALDSLGGRDLILESLVPFDRELSVLAVRSAGGEVAVYPVMENHHREGILRLTLAPAPGLRPEVAQQASAVARRVVDALDHVGVLCVELFEHDGRVLANEIAPRVHNSGHWTIEGAECSQFENHLRAVCDLPLGSTRARGQAAMLNLVGRLPDTGAVLDVPGAHLHLYGKSPRPGRKLGHVTVVTDDVVGRDAVLNRVRAVEGAG